MVDEKQQIEPGTVPLWPTVGRSLGLGRAATYEAARRGDLPVRVIKIGKKLMALRSELARLLAGEKVA